jgi:5-methylcytosine-specific restriction endonuclease McrA
MTGADAVEKRRCYNPAYRAANRDRLNERGRLYHWLNREARVAGSSGNYYLNREKRLIQAALVRDANREEINRKARERWVRDAGRRERKLECRAAWRKLHPEAAVKDASKRKHRLARVYWEPVDRGAIYMRDSGICQICGGPVPLANFVLDHTFPLALGGPHVDWNLRVAHRSCNAKKHTKLVELPPELAALVKGAA